MKFLRERLPPDAILSNGAGNYTTWLHRFYQYRRFRTQLAPTSGAGAATQQRFDPRRQLAKRKGLGQIVIGALSEACHLILFLPSRRQHEDRHVLVGAAVPHRARLVLTFYIPVDTLPKSARFIAPQP